MTESRLKQTHPLPIRSTRASNIIMNTMTNMSKTKLGTMPSIISVIFSVAVTPADAGVTTLVWVTVQNANIPTSARAIANVVAQIFLIRFFTPF